MINDLDVKRLVQYYDIKSSVGWLYYEYLSRNLKISFQEWLCSQVDLFLEELEDFDYE